MIARDILKKYFHFQNSAKNGNKVLSTWKPLKVFPLDVPTLNSFWSISFLSSFSVFLIVQSVSSIWLSFVSRGSGFLVRIPVRVMARIPVRVLARIPVRALFGGTSVGKMDHGSSLGDLNCGSSSLSRALFSGTSVGEMDCCSSLGDLDRGSSSLSRAL